MQLIVPITCAPRLAGSIAQTRTPTTCSHPVGRSVGGRLLILPRTHQRPAFGEQLPAFSVYVLLIHTHALLLWLSRRVRARARLSASIPCSNGPATPTLKRSRLESPDPGVSDEAHHYRDVASLPRPIHLDTQSHCAISRGVVCVVCVVCASVCQRMFR